MSTNGNDDVLVPKGVRYVTRPGVTYIAPTPNVPVAPPPPTARPWTLPSPSTPARTTPSLGSGPMAAKHPSQPKSAPRTREVSAKPAHSVVVDSSAQYRPTAFRSPANARANAALATAAHRNTGRVAEPAPSLTSLTPTTRGSGKHPVQPVPLGAPRRQHHHVDLHATVHHLRRAADAIAGHLDEAHHDREGYDTQQRAENFLDPQELLRTSQERLRALRQQVAKPELGEAEPSRPIWGSIEDNAGGRVEFTY